ncbi:MAG: hypothetical protein KKF78_00765, partial [Candidatus Omnitrophica bacterium]|nr:hypothetical protein [Candidatus Omnitrophota bacterium]
LPLYNKLLLVLKNKQHDQKKLEFFRYAHFSLILFTTIVLVSPISSPKIIPMHKLQSGSYYDVKYSIREGKLFALNQCKQQIEVFTLDGNNFPQIIYKPNYKRESGWNIGHFISLNDDRRELYFTDRARQELIIMDTSDYSVKKAIKSDFVDSGDNYLVSGDNTIYGLTEDYLCVYKINLNSDSNNILFRCLFDGEGAFMEINKTKELLYIMNWKTPSLEYSIYVLDANNLSFHKKHTAPLSGMMITSTNNKIIYQNISNELRILDADSFSIIDRFKLPFTTQDTIFDEKRQLLFAGNFFTGIINIIDLKTKNTISYQRCSDCYTRRIALDTKTRRFFVATYSGGVCVGNY